MRRPFRCFYSLLFISAWILLAVNGFAAVSVDEGFYPQDANNVVTSIALQPDGKIIIGGYFATIGGTARSRIARLNADGSLDTIFDPNVNDIVYSIALQPDGKIIIGGQFTTIGGTARSRIARLNANGSLDADFNPPDANSVVRSIALQPNGKIIIGGLFVTIGGATRNYIARLNADGSLDEDFDPNASSGVFSIALQPNGKILIGGLFATIGGTARKYIARLNADGSLDTDFTPPDANNYVQSIALQPDGKTIIGGNFTTIGVTARSRIARLNADGSLDTTFDPNPNSNSGVKAIALQPDGKIIIGGYFATIGGTVRNNIARLNADGSLDTTFGPNPNGNVEAIALQPDGKTIIGGAFTYIGTKARNRIARLNADGSLEADFDPNASSFVFSIALQPDGKIIIGGDFTAIGGIGRNHIARLNADGSLDTDFNPDANSYVYSVAIQPDGKIIIGGYFTTIRGIARKYIARLNANGSLDTDFTPPDANSYVSSLALQPDGKILIGGYFTTIGSTERIRLARLNADGSLDTTFNPDANSVVNSFAFQPDGKIIIGGDFTTIGGTARKYIARLNADGSLDMSFNPDPNSYVYSLALQPDGKILIGGLFATIGGTARKYIARLNAYGSLDTTFNPDANGTVETIALQSDGKIIIGGAFTFFGATWRQYIARLNANGSLDATFGLDFDPYPYENGTVDSIALQSDGKIIIGGNFTTVGYRARNYIARLSNDLPALQNLSVSTDGTAATWARSGSGPEIYNVVFDLSSDGNTWTSLGTATRIGGGWQLTGLTLPFYQNSYIRARGATTGGYYNKSQGIVESARLFYNNGILTVTKTGTGSGTVTSSPSGIACGSDCSEPYNQGTSVTLTAAPDYESVLSGWSGGGCSGTGTCTVTMDTAKTVTATFTDAIAPTGSLVINGGANLTNSLNVNLTLSCTDASSGCAGMKFSNDGTTWSDPPDTYSTAKAWTLIAGDGLKTVSVQFKDAAGNWSNPYSATITLDQTAPAATISGTPASRTNTTSANLTIGGADVVAYRYKINGGNYGLETSVATSINLSGLAEGSHTVSVIGRDLAENWQAEGSPTTATWIIDITPPIATIAGTPPSPTNSASATLVIGGEDVVVYKYKVDSGNYSSSEIPFATPITLTSLADGSHTVSVIGRDSAGNWQAGGSATTTSWTVDTTKPTGTISINSGALGTTSTTVTLSLTASDGGGSGIVEMTFRNDGDANYTAWEPYSSSRQWTLPAGMGTKTVYVKFRDAVGNESAPYSYTITLETTPPVPVIDYPRNGTALISLDQVTGTVSDADPSSGISKVEVQIKKVTAQGTLYLQSSGTTWGATAFNHLASLVGGSWGFSVGNVWTSEQSYTVTALATDNAGNTGSVSSTFTYYVQSSAFTTLTMDLSSQTILNKGQLVVTGKLSRLPEVNMDLRNLSISLDITSPSGAKIQVNPAVTVVDGSYTFTFPDNNTIFTEKGTYALQAKFAQTGSLSASASDIKAVLVGASAGYAILVQGKLPGPNPEGLASHNKTTNRIYKTLRNRGFDDANIMYFNYTMPQSGIVVDALPSKEGVENAIKGWAGGKMNSVSAPLYIVMVDHGVPNAFHIGDSTISPSELSSWLDTLEASLNQEAKKEKIIVVLGACYSGSFIPQVSKPNTNRIIIASAAADEESYKGPLEGSDTVRSGEYFIDSLFVQLGKGYSLKNSFEEATRETEEYTRKGGALANTPNLYFDTAMQHPHVDDNGDSRGSNVLAQGQGDGQAAKDVYLGTGLTYDTNAGMVEIIAVTETKYLNVSASTASFWLKVNNPTKVSSAWAIIRPPSLDLSQNQTVSSYQRDINLTPQPMPWNQGAGRYELTYNGFTDPGMYEIFYYIIETGIPVVVSPLKRSVVYKDKAGNAAPSAPTLVKPAANEVTRTTLIFQWNASIDTDPVTYNFVIATDSGFSNVVYRKDGIRTTITAVDTSAGLKDLTTYYWRVEAVDGYTMIWSAWRMFKTDNTNGLPGILTGIVFSDRDYSLIAAATIQVTVNNTPVPVDSTADGSFVLSSLPGTATLSISAPGYQPLTVSDVAVVAGETTPVNVRMASEIKKGDLDGDGAVTIADAILALRVLSGIPPLGTLYTDTALANGKIGMADVIYILQKIAGIRAQ